MLKKIKLSNINTYQKEKIDRENIYSNQMDEFKADITKFILDRNVPKIKRQDLTKKALQILNKNLANSFYSYLDNNININKTEYDEIEVTDMLNNKKIIKSTSKTPIGDHAKLKINNERKS